MALDSLPGEVIVRNRDEYVSGMKGAYLAKRPSDIVNDGTFQHALMYSLADQLTGESLNARNIGRTIALADLAGLAVDQRLAERRLPDRFPETGSSGYVVIGASLGGAAITTSMRLTEPNSGAVAKPTAAATYNDGDPVPIQFITTGPSTNFPAGTVLNWSSPPGGLAPTATVQSKLDGGRLAETDEQAKLRISDAEADPAASGNAATYIRLAENTQAHGVPVGKAFVFPAAAGAGGNGLAFTLTPAGPGISRIPSAAHIALVRAYLRTVPENPSRAIPGDDLLYDTTLISQPVSMVLDVKWSQSAAGWKDAARWPIRRAAGAGAIKVAAATDATHFTLARDDANYSGETQPVAGQTICFYSLLGGTFMRKRILSFTGTGPWVITCDTTNSASDTSYTPIVGQRASPWSGSIDDIALPIYQYFYTLGPGEQLSTVLDPGGRGKRYPFSPQSWPSTITNHVVTKVLDLQAIGNSIIQEGLGVSATVGTAGATAYLLELGDIAAFPLA